MATKPRGGGKGLSATKKKIFFAASLTYQLIQIKREKNKSLEKMVNNQKKSLFLYKKEKKDKMLYMFFLW